MAAGVLVPLVFTVGPGPRDLTRTHRVSGHTNSLVALGRVRFSLVLDDVPEQTRDLELLHVLEANQVVVGRPLEFNKAEVGPLPSKAVFASRVRPPPLGVSGHVRQIHVIAGIPAFENLFSRVINNTITADQALPLPWLSRFNDRSAGDVLWSSRDTLQTRHAVNVKIIEKQMRTWWIDPGVMGCSSLYG